MLGDSTLFAYDGEGRPTAVTHPGGGSPSLTKEHQFGTVYYTHAGGVDQPLGVVFENESGQRRSLFPHVNWRGLYTAASDSAGQNCAVPGGSCYGITFPGDRQNAFRTIPIDGSASSWSGSLMADQQDVSGLLYRRNRYYDPQTGQFTQQDPINFSDPFGLCAKGDEVCQRLVDRLREIGGPTLSEAADIFEGSAWPRRAKAGLAWGHGFRDR